MKEDEKINKKDPVIISIVPAFFASACCMFYPLLLMMGFYVSEVIFVENKWEIRLFGIFLLLIFLIFYFRNKGIKSILDFNRHKKQILLMTVYSVFSFIVFYFILIYFVSGFICDGLNIGTCAAV